MTSKTIASVITTSSISYDIPAAIAAVSTPRVAGEFRKCAPVEKKLLKNQLAKTCRKENREILKIWF
jgi:hypothetical protein